MESLEHLMIGFGVVGILLFFSSYFGLNFMGATMGTVIFNIAIILLVSVIIDMDHVLAVGLANKSIPFDFKKLKEVCCSFGKTEHPLILFHTLEFVLILAFASTVFSYYIVLIAVLVHLFVDYIDEPWRFKVQCWFSYNLAQYLKKKEV